MAPMIVDPATVHAFKDAAALERWYAKNHAKATVLWIKVAKKDSGIASVTNAESLDAALCWERAGKPDLAVDAWMRAVTAPGDDAARREAEAGLARAERAMAAVVEAE